MNAWWGVWKVMSCIRWRIGWWNGSKPRPRPRYTSCMLTLSHDINCRDLHQRLCFLATISNFLLLLFNRLPTIDWVLAVLLVYYMLDPSWGRQNNMTVYLSVSLFLINAPFVGSVLILNFLIPLLLTFPFQFFCSPFLPFLPLIDLVQAAVYFWAQLNIK